MTDDALLEDFRALDARLRGAALMGLLPSDEDSERLRALGREVRARGLDPARAANDTFGVKDRLGS